MPGIRSRRRRRIGLLGGSFNPAHPGHLHISLLALSRLRLDQVWWLVSPQNPLKTAEGMAALDRRLGQARRVARHPRIRVDAPEEQLGTRYTAQTLRLLARHHPDCRFVWIMGADNLAQVHLWRDWPEIFRHVPVAVITRPGYDARALSGIAALRFKAARWRQERAGGLVLAAPPAWVFINARRHPESATRLRMLAGGC